MTIARVNPGSWASGDRITQAQINQLDTNITYAVDGRTTLDVQTRAVIRMAKGTPTALIPANWTITYSYANVSSAASQTLYWPIEAPNGCTLTAWAIYYTAAGGHAAFPGGKPATMPTARLYKVDYAGTTTALGSGAITDASATAGSFQTAHVLTDTVSVVIDNQNYYYYIIATTEGGAGAISGASFSGAQYAATVTKLDDGR